MAPTTFTSIVMVAFAAFVLTIASYAWFGDWEPQPRRLPLPPSEEVERESLRRALDGPEREQHP